MSLSTNETTNETTSISSLCIITQTISGYEGFIGGLIVHLPYYFLFYSIIVQWKAFHPFFGLTFGAFLLSYIVIGILIQLVLLLQYFALSNGSLFLFVADATDFMYYFILPINLICALERLFATIFYRKYEKMRPYTAVLIAWLLAIGFGTLLIASENNDSSAFMSRFVQFAMYAGSAISVLICIGVILTNIYMTKRLSGGKGKHPLTARYQLAENIKAVRIILPFIFIDNLITFLELSWTVLYQTSTTYNADFCQKDPHTYIWLFLALIFIRHLMVVSIPPIIFLSSKTLRKPVIKLYYRWLSSTNGRVHSSDSIKRKEFRNVIGEKVIFAQSQDLYFAQLTASW